MVFLCPTINTVHIGSNRKTKKIGKHCILASQGWMKQPGIGLGILSQ